MTGAIQASFQLRISDAQAEAEGYKSQLENLKAHEVQLRGHIKVMTIRALHSPFVS